MQNHGENLATEYLRSLGLEILERNFRSKFGEIDIVARDSDELVFCEVRERSSRDFGGALESVDERKMGRIQKTVEIFLQKNNWKGDYRIDVIGIHKGEIEHIVNV